MVTKSLKYTYLKKNFFCEKKLPFGFDSGMVIMFFISISSEILLWKRICRKKKTRQDTPQNDVSFTVMLFLRNFRLLLKLSANLFLVKL